MLIPGKCLCGERILATNYREIRKCFIGDSVSSAVCTFQGNELVSPFESSLYVPFSQKKKSVKWLALFQKEKKKGEKDILCSKAHQTHHRIQWIKTELCGSENISEVTTILNIKMSGITRSGIELGENVVVMR